MHRRVTEPNRFDECSLTLHHLSGDGRDDSLRGSADDVGGKGVRKGRASEGGGGGELELDELEFSELDDDELVGEFDEESMAASECGWIGCDGGSAGDIDERKSAVFSENLAWSI